MRALAVVASVCLSLSCGGDGGQPAPPPVPGDGGGDPAGGDPAGGGSDPGGGGSTDPGGGASAAPVTFERLSSDGDCAGLLPSAAPAPIVARREPGGACLGGTSDGTGAVALGAREGGAVRWQVHAADGGRAGSFAGAEALPQARGWHVVRVTPRAGEPLVEHVTVAPDGSEARARVVSEDPSAAAGFRWSFAEDPLGGSFVLFRSVNLLGNHWHVLRGHRFAEDGAALWPGGAAVESDSGAAEPLFMAAGVSSRGDALVVYQDSAFLAARWIDRDGRTGPAADEPERHGPLVGEGLEHALALAPLLDGSLALRADGSWRRAYAFGARASSPLPAWLAAREDSTYRFTRGNRGYAVLPPAGRASADCTQAIELVSPTGRLCGRVVLREEGAGCTTGAVDQGWDGTVVQQSGRDPCSYRWWPRLLAGG